MQNTKPRRTYENDTVELIFPWRKAWQNLKAIWPQLIYISLLSMSIPQYLLFFASSQKAYLVGQEFGLEQAPGFESTLLILHGFLIDYFGKAFLYACAAGFGLLVVAALVNRSNRQEPAFLMAAVREAWQALFLRGFLTIFATVIGLVACASFLLLLLPPSLVRFALTVLGVLLSALPALLILEPKKPLDAIKSALSMSYVQGSKLGRWSTFFILMTYQLVGLNLIALVEWSFERLMNIDQWTQQSRDLFFASSAAFPFGKLIHVAEVIAALQSAVIYSGLVLLTSSFVFELRRQASVGRTIETLV